MTVTVEQVEAIVRESDLDKDDTEGLVKMWQPEISEEQFEEMWVKRRNGLVLQ